MSLHRRNPKRDQNEPAIVDALEKAGCCVQRLSAPGFADLIIWHPRVGMVLMEVKVPKTGRLTAAQIQHREGGWPIHVVRTCADALALVGVVM